MDFTNKRIGLGMGPYPSSTVLYLYTDVDKNKIYLFHL